MGYRIHEIQLPDGTLLREFIAQTTPGRIDDADWGGLLAGRSPRSRRLDAASRGAA